MTDRTIDELFYKIKHMDDEKIKIIQDLAVKISTLPEVEKSKVASLIVLGFKRQHVRIQSKLVYIALSKEYGGFGVE